MIEWRAGELLDPWLTPQPPWSDLKLNGLQLDSRHVQAGDLFLAYAGTQTHGLRYLKQAIEQGAVLILSEPCPQCDLNNILAVAGSVPVLFLDGLRSQISAIAARFYDHPAQKMKLIGITGTNGKSSIAYFLAQSLSTHYKVALTGTLGNGFIDHLSPSQYTTSDPITVQKLLAEYYHAGGEVVAMEVSSHALDQDRLAAVQFNTAVFTQLSRDHLDYHDSMLAYANTKRRLFDFAGLEWAVINGDDPIGADWLPELKMAKVVCSQKEQPAAEHFIYMPDYEQNQNGLYLKLITPAGEFNCQTRLFGHFHAQNLMLVAGVLWAWQWNAEQIQSALQSLRPVPGRMEALGGGDQPLVIIDYAHTPDALQSALLSLRQQKPRQLYCIFGCGGDRDQGKRAPMGYIAQSLADQVILTDDNPRSESSAAIIDDILKGMDKSQVQIIPSRKKAIQNTIARAQVGDIILIAGKGHETYQIIGQKKYPFSDREQAMLALKND